MIYILYMSISIPMMIYHLNYFGGTYFPIQRTFSVD